MTRVVVIGGGIAGMGAARELLRHGASVTLLESNPRLGGNCLGIDVPTRTGTTRIDAGVSDFNIDSFSRFKTLLDELGMSHRPIAQTASFATTDGTGRDHRGLQSEIERFKTECVEVLNHHPEDRITVAAYLRAHGYDPRFGPDYLYPRAIGCFSMPEADPREFEIAALVRFWKMHGLVGQKALPRRHCVVGGMNAYCEALQRDLVVWGLTLHCRTRVLDVTRHGSTIKVWTVGGPRKRSCFTADHVVFACAPRGAASLLEDVCPDQASLLADVPFQGAEVFVHTDARLMPRDRSKWAAYNYLIPDGDAVRRPTITFFPNRIRRLSADVPDVFVTMNPHRLPDPKSIIARRCFAHPIASSSAHRVVHRLDELQGRNNVWLCGSWMREPFLHENALASGQDVATRIAAATERESIAKLPAKRPLPRPSEREERSLPYHRISQAPLPRRA